MTATPEKKEHHATKGGEGKTAPTPTGKEIEKQEIKKSRSAM